MKANIFDIHTDMKPFSKATNLGPLSDRYWQIKIIKKNTKVQEIQPQVTFHDIRSDFIFAYLKACMLIFSIFLRMQW